MRKFPIYLNEQVLNVSVLETSALKIFLQTIKGNADLVSEGAVSPNSE